MNDQYEKCAQPHATPRLPVIALPLPNDSYIVARPNGVVWEFPSLDAVVAFAARVRHDLGELA